MPADDNQGPQNEDIDDKVKHGNLPFGDTKKDAASSAGPGASKMGDVVDMTSGIGAADVGMDAGSTGGSMTSSGGGLPPLPDSAMPSSNGAPMPPKDLPGIDLDKPPAMGGGDLPKPLGAADDKKGGGDNGLEFQPKKKSKTGMIAGVAVLIAVVAAVAGGTIFFSQRTSNLAETQDTRSFASGESCGWCAGDDQCYEATGHGAKGVSKSVCSTGKCCTGYSSGGGGGGGGGGTTKTTTTRNKSAGDSCTLGQSDPAKGGCDSGGPLGCNTCPSGTKAAGQARCYNGTTTANAISACGGTVSSSSSSSPSSSSSSGGATCAGLGGEGQTCRVPQNCNNAPNCDSGLVCGESGTCQKPAAETCGSSGRCRVYTCTQCTNYGDSLDECRSNGREVACNSASISGCGQIDFLDAGGNYCGVKQQACTGSCAASGGGGGNTGGGGSTPRPTATARPTVQPTAAPTVAAAVPICVAVKTWVFDDTTADWVETTAAQLGTQVVVGDTIRFTVAGSGASFTKARFSMGSTSAPVESTDLFKGGYYWDYQVASGGTFAVSAEVFAL